MTCRRNRHPAWLAPMCFGILVHSTLGQGLASFPLEAVVRQAMQFVAEAPLPAPLPTNTKPAYLTAIQGSVETFWACQDHNESSPSYGKIIDPYAGIEIQMSTPTWAFGAVTLLANGVYNASVAPKLLADASLALDVALTALAFGQPHGDQGCAQGHCNFYTLPISLAIRQLIASNLTTPAQVAKWAAVASSIEVTKSYTGPNGWTPGNWGVVALVGEYARYTLGPAFGANLTWIDEGLQQQWDSMRWTANGQYQDLSGCEGECSPLPYDHFPRKQISVLLALGYNGPLTPSLVDYNRRGALVSLLLLSPRGELPTGGRSSQHQWNEAASCVTFEFWAKQYASEGNATYAAAFKRAAALSMLSLSRWKMPGTTPGPWFIVKNQFDPALRHGYESYSFFSQYNLVPTSMLSQALLVLDETVTQGATPAEVGGFSLSPDEFHVVVANVGGLYAEVELFPDTPEHDTLGLTRVHSATTDSLVAMSAGFPLLGNPQGVGAGAAWGPSADAVSGFLGNTTYTNVVSTIVSTSTPTDPTDPIVVNVSYAIVFAGGEPLNVTETYTITSTRVSVTSQLGVAPTGAANCLATSFPALLFDGRRTGQVSHALDGTLLLQMSEPLPGDVVSCASYSVTTSLPSCQPRFSMAGNFTSRNGFGTVVTAADPCTCGQAAPVSITLTISPLSGQSCTPGLM